MIKRRPKGFWFLVGFGIVLNIIYLLGQTMSIINYDFAVTMGLQEPVDQITAVGVAVNKGFGFGDTFFYIPLFVIGILGLFRWSSLGLHARIGFMAVTVYWPVVSLSMVFYARGAEGWSFTNYTAYSVLLSIIALYGLFGLIYLFKNRKLLVHEENGNS